MNGHWPDFFPPNTRVGAIPSWERPRVLFPAEGFLQRWAGSALYPAHRLSARIYRLALRAGAAAGGGFRTKVSRGTGSSLESFLDGSIADVASTSVLMGTPGPTQKAIIELRRGDGVVIGYVKYGESAAARRRLTQEFEVLSQLPTGLGPIPLKHGPWQHGEALVVTPVRGRPVSATLPPHRGLAEFCSRLELAPPVDLADHPWVKASMNVGEEVEALVAPLAGRQWAPTARHGDLVAWNLKRQPDDSLQAFDWEYGSLVGFPFLDQAFYVLQIASHMLGWKPERAVRYGEAYLMAALPLPLTPQEARSLVRLSAWQAYRMALADGHQTDAPLQRWYEQVWKGWD